MKKIVKLTTPVEAFGKPVHEIELKEPNGQIYFRLGEPRVAVVNASGSAYWVENNTVITAYLDYCIVNDMGEAITAMLTIDDAMALKESLFGFFSEAAQRRLAAK